MLAARAMAYTLQGRHELGQETAEASLRDYTGYFLAWIIKAICAEALNRETDRQDAVRACRSFGLEVVTPDGCANAWRRLFAPEGFAMIEPALAIYRKAWNATPEEGGE
jgi:hypothetical protein